MTFSDQDAFNAFDVTTSRLRTAQRYGLIKANVPGAGEARQWSSSDVLLTVAAEEVAHFLALPFDVGVQILSAMGGRAREAITSPETAPEAIRKAVPAVALYDRTLLCFLRGDEVTQFGKIVRGEKTRHAFEAVDRLNIGEPACDGYAEVCIAAPVAAFKRKNLQKLFA